MVLPHPGIGDVSANRGDTSAASNEWVCVRFEGISGRFSDLRDRGLTGYTEKK